MALPAKELYQCDNVRTVDAPARTNLGTLASFRAPGVVEGMAGLEMASTNWQTRLAWIRWSCAARTSPRAIRSWTGHTRVSCCWMPTRSARSASAGPRAMPKSAAFPLGRASYLRRGVGMASQLWGGEGGPPAQAIAKLLPDGTAIILTGTQDIGTGTRTVLAQIAAEELDYPLEHVRVELGDSAHGVYSPPSGGSMTLASIGPAVRMAAAEARKELLEIVSNLAEAPVDALEVRDGKILARETGREMGDVASFLRQLDGHEITARGMRGPNAEDVSVRTFGAQFAEVEVDVGTGQVRVLQDRRGARLWAHRQPTDVQQPD